jgi:hypothetical protein
MSRFLQVTVGNHRVLVGFVRYERSFWDNDPFRYGVVGSVGGALLFIVLGVVCCCCGCCRRRGGSKGSSRGVKAQAGLETGMLASSSRGSNDYVDKGYTSKRN